MILQKYEHKIYDKFIFYWCFQSFYRIHLIYEYIVVITVDDRCHHISKKDSQKVKNCQIKSNFD